MVICPYIPGSKAAAHVPIGSVFDPNISFESEKKLAEKNESAAGYPLRKCNG